MSSYLQGSMVPYCMPVALRTESGGSRLRKYVPRKLSCKCSLCRVAAGCFCTIYHTTLARCNVHSANWSQGGNTPECALVNCYFTSVKNVRRCMDSRTAKSKKTSRHKTVQYTNPSYISFHIIHVQ